MLQEIKLIQRAPVLRDAEGMFGHPDLPSFDECDGDKCKQRLAEQGLVIKASSIEGADDSIFDRYFESDDPDCSYWELARPDGEGWFYLSIFDTNYGQVCWLARREITP